MTNSVAVRWSPEMSYAVAIPLPINVGADSSAYFTNYAVNTRYLYIDLYVVVVVDVFFFVHSERLL
jgi:hypothetical protein